MLVVAAACDRRIVVYVDEPAPSGTGTAGAATGTSGASGGSSAGTSGGPSAGASGGSSAGAAGGASAGTGGTTPDAGSRDAGSGGGADGPACAVDSDCPPPDRTCAVARCSSGRCEAVDAPAGAAVPNVPADCHASICDGQGRATSIVVDPTNVPSSDNPCVAANCSASGDKGTTPLAAGTTCTSGQRKGTCDGAGSCVECNHTSDCPPGLFCDAHHFCGSAACTDLDCGGACGPCGPGKHCLVDSDCQSLACDAATTTCIQNQCLDHRQDGDETDADCGGGACPGCAVGLACVLDSDCRNQACDTRTLKCISNQCADHRLDGAESDVDCGGGGCGPCFVGQACKSNFDCQSGHFCNGIKVCQ
jgi:hypothetical protein